MKTRIDYFNLYSKIEKFAEEELKEALMKFPDNEYEFITEEEAENMDVSPLIIGMESHFSGECFNMIVTKVCLYKGNLEIWGFNADGGDYSYQDMYSASDVQRGHLHYITEELPEQSEKKDDERKYTYMDMENAVHLAADLMKRLEEYGQEENCNFQDMRTRSDFIICRAVELNKRLGYKNEDEGDYDYVEELEKFEEEILKTL